MPGIVVKISESLIGRVPWTKHTAMAGLAAAHIQNVSNVCRSILLNIAGLYGRPKFSTSFMIDRTHTATDTLCYTTYKYKRFPKIVSCASNFKDAIFCSMLKTESSNETIQI